MPNIKILMANDSFLFTCIIKQQKLPVRQKIKIILGLAFIFILNAEHSFAQSKKYQVYINLTEVKNDMVKVELKVPEISKEEIEYQMPKIVPGTYSIYDFGRFIHEFKAIDQNGKEMEVDRITENRWLIKNATKLDKITYWVEDTYDTKLDNVVFEPAGTNIEEGKNFLINTYGFIGYLEGLKNKTFEVNITRPETFYGATSMKLVKTEKNTDTYSISNYFDLADAPIMYSKPDTATVIIGGAEILVAVYSPRKLIKSKFVMDNVKEILSAQKEYLGGKLPIDKYAFIIYLTDKPSLSGAMGALEHSYSSVYYLPEINPDAISQTIKDIAAHEFFHIVTPLNLHSEEIHDFDFIEPKMSKHLWLYEGVTEYASSHVQITQGLIDEDDYLRVIKEKIVNSQSYNDTVPFTVMSKKCLNEYKKEYGNVYQKGALIGLSLDILIRKETNGSKGLQDIINELSLVYGKDKAFKDDELFDKFTELTSPKIREFFAQYVEGPNPLPLTEILAKVGIEYHPSHITRQVTLGNIGLGFNPETQRLTIHETHQMNEFGHKMGYAQGDEIVSLNGKTVTVNTYAQVISAFKENTKEGDIVKVVVARKNKQGKFKNKTLKAKAIEVEAEEKHYLRAMQNPSEEQRILREAWLKRK
jgi:predicted metalloprotease with PDZ domain